MRNSSKLLAITVVLLVGLTVGKSAYAQTQSISVTGNGSNSVNSAATIQNQSTFLTQSNTSSFSNSLSVNADSGHNSADSNTKGDSSISTGSITSSVQVNNTAGSNKADVCCQGSPSSSDPLSVVISGNGAFSNNQVSTSHNNTNVLNQESTANLTNNVGGDLNTGSNSTSSNTDGVNHVSTGSIFSSVGINNLLNSNAASILCCSIVKPVVNPTEPPAGGLPIPSLPVAALVQTPAQVLAASKASVLPMTGAGDTMWIMSLASLVLMFGFFVRRSASSLLMSMLGA